MSVKNAVLLNIPKIPDERGNLSFLQSPDQIPFPIRQVYWINDIPSGAERKGKANRQATELIIALSGSFDVLLVSEGNEQTFSLNRPDIGLLVPAMVWQQMLNFSTNSVAFVITDQEPEHEGIISAFSDFKNSLPDASTL